MYSNTTFQDLPDEIRVQVFNCLTFAARRCIVPLVCREWHQLTLRCPGLYEAVTLCATEEQEAWELLEKEAGRVPHSTLATQSVARGVVIRWFQRHPFALSLVAEPLPEIEEQNDQKWNWVGEGQGCLLPIAAAMKDTLQSLIVHPLMWVNKGLCICDLCWLSRLEVLELGSFEGDEVQFLQGDFEAVSCLCQLKTLHVYGHCSFSSGDLKSLASLTGLQSLVFEEDARFLAGDVGVLSSLTGLKHLFLQGKLDLSGADLEGLACLTSLTHLCFFGETGDEDSYQEEEGRLSFPESFSLLRNLEELKLYFLPELSCPRNLGAFCNLKQLALQTLGFVDKLAPAPLPASLTSLDMTNFKFTLEKVDRMLRPLTALVELSLAYSYLEQLPPLAHMGNVRKLCFTVNMFKVLPVQELLGLPLLEEIDFSDQQSGPVEIPASVTRLSCLVSLKRLSLASNDLSAASLEALRELEEAVRLSRPLSEFKVITVVDPDT